MGKRKRKNEGSNSINYDTRNEVLLMKNQTNIEKSYCTDIEQTCAKKIRIENDLIVPEEIEEYGNTSSYDINVKLHKNFKMTPIMLLHLKLNAAIAEMKKCNSNPLKDFASMRAKVKSKAEYNRIKSSVKKFPSFHLKEPGVMAQIHLPDARRKPLSFRKIKLLLYTFLFPSCARSYSIDWFKSNHFDDIPAMLVIIVDGISVSTFQELNIEMKIMDRYHKNMVQNGTVGRYNGFYVADELEIKQETSDAQVSNLYKSVRAWLPTTLSITSEAVLEFNTPPDTIFSLPQDLFYLDHYISENYEDKIHRQQVKQNAVLESKINPEDLPNISSFQELAQLFGGVCGAADISSPLHWARASTPQLLAQLSTDNFDRRYLLMTFTTLINLKFPFPPGTKHPFTQDILCKSNESVVATKEKYVHVHANSPLFGIDCEFYSASIGKPRMIGIVNEAGETVYFKHITRYEEKCDKLNYVTLKEMQGDIRRCLPPDAILVGHQLDHDLQKMKMCHPYILDTTSVFNMGTTKSNALKSLSFQFLNREIQMTHDHDPVEDALATLDLVKFKLSKTFYFGNIKYTGQVTQCHQKIKGGISNILVKQANDYMKRRMVNYQMYSVFTTYMNQHLWKQLINTAVTNICQLNVLQDNEEIMKNAMEMISKHKLTIVHLQADPRVHSTKRKPRLAVLAQLDQQLTTLIEALPQNACFNVIMSEERQLDSSHPCPNGIFLSGIIGKERTLIDEDSLE